MDRLFLDFQSAIAGRYSLERELGRGGMGVVYLAREVRLDRPVAIKLLPPSKASDPKLRERFLRENGGRLLVAGFGIASAVAGAGALTTGEVVGTPEFMSPEQALGEPVDARSDLYSLGVVGYFACSGALPFEAEKATDILAKQVTEPAPPLTAVAPLVPRRLAQAIDRCLAKDPTDRPEGPAALAEQLSHALEQRRELPVALRAFVKHDARLDGSGVFLYAFAMLFVTPLSAAVMGSA